MKRRQFNFGLLAATAAPLAPAGALTQAATPSATANFTPFLYAQCTNLARQAGRCSPELLAEKLGLAPQLASTINARMIRQGILSAPNALGISQATDKYAFKPVAPKPVAAKSATAKSAEITSQPEAAQIQSVRVEASELVAEDTPDTELEDRLEDAQGAEDDMLS